MTRAARDSAVVVRAQEGQACASVKPGVEGRWLSDVSRVGNLSRREPPPELPMKLTSHGHEIDTSPAKFGELRDSSALAADMPALRGRIAEDGYLFLRGYLDRDVVMAARQESFGKLARLGSFDPTAPLLEGFAAPRSERRDYPEAGWKDQAAFAKDLRTGAAIRELCHRGRIITFFQR